MLGIVFPALPDLASLKGDRRLSNPSSDPLRESEGGRMVNSGLHDQDDGSSHISYSVSYFNWSVSDQSSGGEEDEVENVTLQLDRVKIRSNRNENLNRRTLNKDGGKQSSH